jgi:hypothetical protein
VDIDEARNDEVSAQRRRRAAALRPHLDDVSGVDDERSRIQDAIGKNESGA